MATLRELTDQLRKESARIAAISDPRLQAMELAGLWELWAGILRVECDAIEAAGQAANKAGTLAAWLQQESACLGDGFFMQGIEILRVLRDMATELRVDAGPLGRAIGLIQKAQAGLIRVDSTGTTAERMSEAFSKVGTFFDDDLKNCLLALRAALEAAGPMTLAELKTAFIESIAAYFDAAGNLDSLGWFADRKRAERKTSVIASDAELIATDHLAAADAAATAAREKACRVGPLLAAELKRRALDEKNTVGRMIKLLKPSGNRKTAADLWPDCLTALHEKPTAAEYHKTILQLALGFEGFGNGHKGKPPEAKSRAMDDLCRDTAAVIFGAAGDGHLRSLPGLAALIDFHCAAGPLPEDRAPSYARNGRNLVSDLQGRLMAAYPERFIGKVGDDGTATATALRILADAILPPERAAATVAMAATPAEQGKRKARGPYAKTELTPKQVEATELLGIHQTKTKAARAMGISRTAFDKHHNAAMKKLGRLAARRKPRTEQPPIDNRGQETLSRNRRTD
ncbi:MAG: hypothetical protein ACP5O7_12570 [Phycisphaerae bacterium]